MPLTFTQIGDTGDWWVWALQGFNGKLYIGTYEMGAPKAFNYPPWQYIKTFAAGESVPDFCIFLNKLYAATEDKGYIYRMKTADPTDWPRVHEDAFRYALYLEEMGGKFYCGLIDTGQDETKILESSTGDLDSWEQVALIDDADTQSSVLYKDEMYILGRYGKTGEPVQCRVLKSSNGSSWANVPALCNISTGIWYGSVVCNGNLYLGLGEIGGAEGTSKIYKYDGSTATVVLSVNTPFLPAGCVFHNEIYFLTAVRWKSTGDIYLYKSTTGASGTWEKIWTFPGGNFGRAIGVHDDHLYLGVGGKVYRMDEEEEAPIAPSNCAAHFVSPDKSFCSWEDNSDDETGFRVEHRVNAPAWAWLPTKEMGGVLSLSTPITISEYDYCGFDFLIPFASSGLVDLLEKGVHAIINTSGATGEWGGLTVEQWSEISGVEAFFLGNDCPYDVELIESWYNAIKARTNKPVGAIFWKPPHETDRNRLIQISNFLDFILVYWYPYRDGKSQEDIDADIAYMVALAGDLNCPVIIGAQAMDDDFEGMADPGEVGVRNQHEQYYNANVPISWYSWTNTITDIKRNYQDLMNELCHGWTFFENKGVNAVQSSQKQFSAGDYVKWRVRAYNAIGASAWAVSDTVYLGGVGNVKEWTTQADFEAGSLSDVLVPEGLNRLELKRLALSGTGVWIYDGGPGRKFKWLSFEHTNPNQNIYYRDDFRDNLLEAWTIVGGTWQGVNQYMRGTGNLSWGSNRVLVGPTTWAGLDILCKGYYSSTGAPGHRFYLRADTQGDSVNAYGFVLYNDGNAWVFRVANGSVLENIDKGISSPADNTWYWFRIQIYSSGGNVIQRIRWWPVGNEEPGDWNVDHTWTEIWRDSGCFSLGRHTTAGENRYDNILLSRQEGIPSPPNCSVSFKFWASNDGTTWGSQYTDITKVPDSRFIKIQATLARTDLLSAMPTLEDMTLRYRLAVQPIWI